MPWASSVLAIALGAGGWAIYKICQIGKREPFLPPGPPTIPFFGNLLIFPKTHLHLQFTKWAKEYGDIYSLKLAHQNAIVITSAAAARDLMDKASALTSDRPPSHVSEITFDGKHIAMARYGDKWKKLRRGAREILTPEACKRHLPIQKAEASQLLYEILTRPEEFYSSIRRYSSSVLFSVLYGKRAPQITTPDITAYFEIQQVWEDVATPGSQPPIDIFPILKWVPERFASWKGMCRQIRQLTRKSYFGLLDQVEKRMARGESNGCFVETLCSRAEEWGLDREMIGHIGGNLFDAGADTTSSVLQSLVLALVAFPEVQRKAQEEIDALIGLDRPPTLEDIEDLPYVQAVVKEILRFRPPGPFSVPHATSGDVMYKGYRIPAGTIIFVNMWGILHDEQVFENESDFNPDRYLKSPFGIRDEAVEEMKDWKEDFAFGHGRRACPGIYLAKNSIAINTVNLLWAFNFGKCKDSETGVEVMPDLWDYANAVATFPNPFKCVITPRSQHHAEMIQRQLVESTDAFLPFEQELADEDLRFVTEQRKCN